MRDRYLRHACVLAAVAAIPLVAPRAAEQIASTPVLAQVGDATRTSATIERALGPSIPERPAQTIRVARGDTLETLAATFRSDVAAMRWANNLLQSSQPAPGSTLLVPPGPGALVAVHAGERPSEFAARLGLDPRVVLDYNVLRSDAPLPAGAWLQVPRGAAPVGGSLRSADVVPAAAGVPAVPAAQMVRAEGGRFPWGQCTWYVWTRRYVPWNGDAWAWFGNARAYGRPEGRIPVQGAIAVMWGSWVGHVAYVEHVNPDGSFLISEMNVRGLGVYDERTVTPGAIDLIGFIY